MKKFIPYSLLILVVALLAATPLLDIFGQLDYTEDKAKENFIALIGKGNFSAGSDQVKKARSLPDAAKAEGVRELIRFAKSYAKTPAFKKQYGRWRDEQLGYKTKKKLGIPNPMKMLDKAVDKELNKGEDAKKIPADPEELLRRRLQEFLDLSATVDFDAVLNGRQFADPAYERKSNAWKMCYRAGKPVVDAAREEISTWLKELE